jgi:putative colanic acid biosynthesis acetyltransferase WcaF
MHIKSLASPDDTDVGTPIPNATLQVRVSKVECPSPHTWGNKLGRVLWAVVYVALFRPSPRICYAWRRMLLRCFGARIGRNTRIHPTARLWAPWNLTVGTEASVAHDVDCYCVDRIEIGDHATVSQYAMLCTASHDLSDPNMRLVTAPIVISPQAWVCARAFVAPGVAIGIGAVVGAQSVVTRDVPAWTVVAGSPARAIKLRELSDGQPTQDT